MSGGHNHDHHHHADGRRLKWALGITAMFMVVEAIGGWLSGSLALLADAGHMLTDTAALGLAWMALVFSSKPPDPQRSYGYHRMQVLVAFANGLALFGIVLWIGIEAIDRFREPVPVLGMPMLLVAAVGLVVNIVAFAILHGAQDDNINIRSAALHVLGDLLGSVAAIVAAVCIITTGWTPIDPILSILVAALILRSAWRVIAESGHILLEGTPPDIDIDALKTAVAGRVESVADIHHVHLWSLSPNKTMLTMHASLLPDADPALALAGMKQCLADDFGIDHSTIQIDPGLCADHCENNRAMQFAGPQSSH